MPLKQQTLDAKEDPLWEEKEEKGEDDEHDWRDDAGEPVDMDEIDERVWRDDDGEPVDMDGFWSSGEGEEDME